MLVNAKFWKPAMQPGCYATERDYEMVSRRSLGTGKLLDREEFDIANRLYFRLYQSSNLLHKVGTRYVSEYGATTQQWAVLGALARPAARNGLAIKELLEFLLVSRQNLTPLLDRLEARGWIERVKDPADGRNRRIELTAEGRELWSKIVIKIGDFYSDSLQELTMDEKVNLYHLLDKLKVNLNST